MLQYITNTECGRTIPEQVKAVLNAGCRWIQLSMPGASHDEVAAMAKTIKPLTDEQEAFLIITDDIDVCRDVNCTGVHLASKDVTPSKARTELGPLAVIGMSVNSFPEIEAVRSLDIDYLTFSPFRTCCPDEYAGKPMLGIPGMTELCRKMKEADINIAHVACGDVAYQDVRHLLDAGCDGIAVSRAIAMHPDMEKATRNLIALLPAGE